MSEAKKTYVCGVCEQEREGSPTGGASTRMGVIVTCSGECWTKAMQRDDIVPLAEMAANVAKMS